MTPQEFLDNHANLSPEAQLEGLVSVLRGPEGCPWDQKQTAASMIDYVIDEAHELKEALDREPHKANEELGDLLFTLRFVQQAMGEEGSSQRAVDTVVEKMIRRHPHVFAKENFDTDSDIRRNWEAEKRREQPSVARMDRDLPASMPALKRAQKVLGRAMGAGFRYPSEREAWDKVEEEFCELQDALSGGDNELIEEELGDLLLALLTIAKERKIKAADALRRAERKLCDRLENLERRAGKPLAEIPKTELAKQWHGLRSDQSPGEAYFNYCGVSRWPRPVRMAVRDAVQRISSDGLMPVLELREQREQLRAEIARIVGAAEGDQVVFSPNISSSALAVGYCQDWRPGDSVMIGSKEFPANTVPWAVAAKTFDVELVTFQDDRLRTEPEEGWAELSALLEKHRPRVLAISAVSFWSGYRVDLNRLCALCHSVGTRLFVDAIQALGTVPLSMASGIDYLAAGSHKGLLSPECAGFLVVAKAAGQNWEPRFGSWLSLPDPVDFLIDGRTDSLPRTFLPSTGRPLTLEGGSVNTIGYAGLGAAIAWLSEHGAEAIFEHIQELHDLLEEGLVALGWRSLRCANPQGRSAILAFEPPPGTDLLKAHEHLTLRGVIAGTPNGRLRFGFHVFNTRQDVERALEALAETR